MAAFVAVLLCSNLIGASKRAQIGGFTFGAAVFFFPISYIFGDVLTEVYGYARSRRVVWAGFAALLFSSITAAVVLAFPPAPDWPHQATFEIVFGSTMRINLASLLAFFFGEFANSFVMAKMKIRSEGKHLWKRTIGSTIVGEAVDSLIFYPLAFWAWPMEQLQHGLDALGIHIDLGAGNGWSWAMVFAVLKGNYILKVLWEVLMTPLTYKVVNFLKRVENEDYYDRDTNFTPFSLKT